jgi:PEP-CTERM motif-containing protein
VVGTIGIVWKHKTRVFFGILNGGCKMRTSLLPVTLTIVGAVVAVSLATVGSALAGGSACSMPVPEPSTMAILGGGVAGILYLHRRKAKK